MGATGKLPQWEIAVLVPVAGMQQYYYRLTLVIAVVHSTPFNTLYHNLVVVLCVGMSL